MTDGKNNLDIGAVKYHPSSYMRTLFIFLATTLIIGFCGLYTVQAQVQLERISVSERSDGRGFVVRNHLTESPDSFRVYQPEANRIQFVIYAENLDIEDFQQPEPFPGMSEIRYYVSEGNFGYEIYFQPDTTYRSVAYFDVNQTHVLINLEQTAKEELDRTGYTEEFIFNDDDQLDESDSEESVDVELTPESDRVDEPVTAETVPQGERIRTTIGIKGGYTSANFYGVGYDRSPRNGISVATFVVIELPARLPYNITSGIETGIYFMQKGFDEPMTDKLIADRVEIDYVEIPLLVKLNYDRAHRFSPHLVFGPYLSFMASSERIFGDDETRRDLDDVTKKTDFGWTFGAGVDITVGDVIFDFQLRNSLSFEPLFIDEEFDDGEKLRQFSLLLGIRF